MRYNSKLENIKKLKLYLKKLERKNIELRYDFMKQKQEININI